MWIKFLQAVQNACCADEGEPSVDQRNSVREYISEGMNRCLFPKRNQTCAVLFFGRS